jgi:hypothetical protein
MRRIIVLLVLFAIPPLAQQPHSSPEQLKGFVEGLLQPYFPNAKGVILPDQHVIVGVTCTRGISAQSLNKLRDFMASDQEIGDKLALLDSAQSSGYKVFTLGFEEAFIGYNLQTHGLEIVPRSDDTRLQYRQTCGFE